MLSFGLLFFALFVPSYTQEIPQCSCQLQFYWWDTTRSIVNITLFEHFNVPSCEWSGREACSIECNEKIAHSLGTWYDKDSDEEFSAAKLCQQIPDESFQDMDIRAGVSICGGPFQDSFFRSKRRLCCWKKVQNMCGNELA